MKYVQTHFKTAHKHFGTNKLSKLKKEHVLVLNKLASAIESTYGRLKPYHIHIPENFAYGKTLKAVKRGKHFSELDGPTFEDLVVRELAKVSPTGKSNMVDNEVSSTQHEPSTSVVKMEQPDIKVEVDDKSQAPILDLHNEEDIKDGHTEPPAEVKDSVANDNKQECKEEYQDEYMLNLHNEEIEVKDMLGSLDEPLSICASPVINSSQEVVVIDDDDDDSQIQIIKREKSLSSMSIDSSQGSHKNGFLCSDNIPLPKKSPVHVENSHSSRGGNSPSSNKRSPIRKISPSHSSFSFSRLRDSPVRSIDSSPRRRESPIRRGHSPFSSKDSSSRRRESPSRRRFSPLHRRDSPSRRRHSPSRRRYSPSRRRFSPLHREDSPSRRRHSPSRRRHSPSRRRHSPSRRRHSPSRRRHSSSPSRYTPSRRDSPLRRKYSRSRSRDSPLRRRNTPLRSNSRSRRKDRKRRHSPTVSKDRSGSRSRNKGESHKIDLKRMRDFCDKYSDSSEDDDNNIVGLLEKLAALENELGPLWSRMLDLFSNALEMEIKKLNSSEDLLDNEDNYVLFKTVGRRLKGLLNSGLVDESQKKNLENIEREVKSVTKRAKQRKQRIGQEYNNVLVVPAVGIPNKENISMQIVSTLLAQGKRYITQEEIDEVIRVLASRNGPQSISGCLTHSESHQKKPILRETNEENLYRPSSTPQSSSRTNEEESNNTFRLEEKRMLKKLEDVRLLLNSVMDDQEDTVSIFSKPDNEGVSKPPSDRGGAYSQCNNNQPLPSYEHSLRGGASSHQPIAGQSNFEWREAQTNVIPEGGGHLNGEMTGARDRIVDLKDVLSGLIVEQNVNMGGFMNCNCKHRGISTSSGGKSRSNILYLKKDHRNISNFQRPSSRQQENNYN